MRALMLDSDGSLSVAMAALPTHADECLIRVTRAGICGTDLQMLDGYANFTGIPGHEFVGIVEDAPSADGHWMGHSDPSARVISTLRSSSTPLTRTRHGWQQTSQS